MDPVFSIPTVAEILELVTNVLYPAIVSLLTVLPSVLVVFWVVRTLFRRTELHERLEHRRWERRQGKG